VSVDTLIATDGLATGEVDVTIAPEGSYPGLHSVPLYFETGIAILARDHPYRGRALSRKAFNEIPQVVFNVALGRPGYGRKAADRAFQGAGLSAAPALTVSSFAAAALVVASTHHLACMPKRVATVLARYLPIRLLTLPLEEIRLPMTLVWHARTDADGAAAYFRQLVVSALQEGQASPARSRPARRNG
jgi:DNA-binding transcriptional LysR family regulator